MKKDNVFTSLLGEVPALTQDAEGLLKGGFAAFFGDDNIALCNNDSGCFNNTNCSGNTNCENNYYCSGNENCYYLSSSPTRPGGPGKPTGKF